MKHMAVGADIAKNVMQLHYIDAETGEIVNKPVKRAVFLEHFANRAPCLIGMEACGGSQYWARKLTAMGHEVKLMPGKFVKAFVMGNKNDAVDAKAIWLAVQHAERSVAVKTETQQAVLGLHRMREQLVKFRTMQINGLRGLLTEYGEVMGKGRAALDKAIPSVLERLVDRLPAILIDTLREQWNGLAELDKQIAGIERRLQMWMKEDKACKAIAAIPGVGLLTATAAVATMGDVKTFRSGREFAAWIGLVPKQTGSGGKVQLLGISKRGDTYLRKLLIHGARAVLCLTKEPEPWAEGIRKRRPLNVAVVAQANRTARTIWAILAHDRPYEKGYVSV
ncbi:IS110 family transposase [Burkholderia sp. BE12]|uniref:IS110 family transposase n=1 Tax=Burkholderia sp. BE12 TaxID=2082394 RepID=UPI000CF47614|nr:IS110 family transposase [Burkholderia sp. BE12]